MSDGLDVKVEASLGQLAVSLGVITAAQRDRMGIELFQRARKGTPTSLARLLLQGGLNAQKVQELLAFGAHLPAVRCDACELGIPQAQLQKREEVPCPRCRSLVLGFAVYADGSNKKSAAADEDDTKPLTAAEAAQGIADTTERWRDVLPVPGAPSEAPRPGAGTDRWPGVLALPPAPRSGPHALPPPRSGGHALPARTPPTNEGESADDLGGQTMTFGNVLPAPSDGTMQLFPVGASGEPAPARTPPPTSRAVKLNAPPSARAQPPQAPPGTDRTMAFNDVFLLPGRSAPRTDVEVTDEMHTLLAPAGFVAQALSGGGSTPGDFLPPGFDPGAVTAPLQRDEIQAMLRQGPPPPRSAPSHDEPAPTIFLPPPTASPGETPETTPRKTGKRARKGAAEAAPRRRRAWVVVLVLLLALAAGAATAWKLGLLPLPR